MESQICRLATPWRQYGETFGEHEQPVAVTAAQADGTLELLLRIDRAGGRGFIRLPKAILDVDSETCCVTMRNLTLFDDSATLHTDCVLGAKVCDCRMDPKPTCP